MMPFLPGRWLVALLCACAVVPFDAAAAAASLCAHAAKRSGGDARIGAAIEEARRQHVLFGAQRIERDGALVRLGYHEAEWDRLPGESTPAWQRVAAFWQALSPDDPPHLMTSVGLVARSEVSAHVPANGREPRTADVAIDEALLRAAIVDTPWSAAFISYLMKSAGFSPAEFEFSDSHADYVRAALETSAAEAAGRQPSHAFRACDVATTPPRAGDLLCATRASSAAITSFDALALAMAQAAVHAFPMHCELVVRSDAGADAKIDTIGGNVVQSVTLSRMTLNAKKVLSASYIGAAPPPGCARGGQPCRTHLSRRPWVVLLQFRN